LDKDQLTCVEKRFARSLIHSSVHGGPRLEFQTGINVRPAARI
jgi:hypothetical protein